MKIVTFLSLILVGVVFVLTLTACEDAPEKNSDDKTADSKQTVISEKSNSRIDDLVKAWVAAGYDSDI